MNPLVLLPLLVAGCVAAPTANTVAMHGAPLPLPTPLALQQELTAHLPADEEFTMVGEAEDVAHLVAADDDDPGYTVQGEIDQVNQTVATPEPAESDATMFPFLANYTALAADALDLPVGEVKALEVPALAPMAVDPASLIYSNLNLNASAPMPEGEADDHDELV
ncbi:uncharacterized protein [Panulirus ornatus]|uniref:uncharacterized protein n=1 Tax=Panulirus ornatus TaxID=150431 RepID=UPI003A84E9E6